MSHIQDSSGFEWSSSGLPSSSSLLSSEAWSLSMTRSTSMSIRVSSHSEADANAQPDAYAQSDAYAQPEAYAQPRPNDDPSTRNPQSAPLRHQISASTPENYLSILAQLATNGNSELTAHLQVGAGEQGLDSFHREWRDITDGNGPRHLTPPSASEHGTDADSSTLFTPPDEKADPFTAAMFGGTDPGLAMYSAAAAPNPHPPLITAETRTPNLPALHIPPVIPPSLGKRSSAPPEGPPKKFPRTVNDGKSKEAEPDPKLDPAAHKRWRNNIAARKARKVKANSMQELKNELASYKSEATVWRDRALLAAEMLREMGVRLDFSVEAPAQ
ncbi:hypothetical protein K438DRAFT_1747847 [Mycena galopus ATCC 62051]|nr:hypothetical protein K438DRAFT_1747847 [Mycena galopus ATCC 62051]